MWGYVHGPFTRNETKGVTSAMKEQVSPPAKRQNGPLVVCACTGAHIRGKDLGECIEAVSSNAPYYQTQVPNQITRLFP